MLHYKLHALPIVQNLVEMLQMIEQSYKSEYNQSVINVIILLYDSFASM